MRKLEALIAGSTGYIGIQLIKLLIKHKNIKIKYLCGNTSVGKKISFFDKSLKKKNYLELINLTQDILIKLILFLQHYQMVKLKKCLII